MTNIAEILKDCPIGTKLYSPICGECTFDSVNVGYVNVYKENEMRHFSFNHLGQHCSSSSDSECLLFPSKSNRDWSRFQRPFKEGDIISNDGYIAIFYKFESDYFYYHCWCSKTAKQCKFKTDFGIGRICEYKYATEEEKAMLFNAIDENGYNWNEETNTLEKVTEPKFENGNIIYNPGIKAISILQSNDSDKSISHAFFNILGELKICHYHSADLSNWRFATEDEKTKLFNAIKENGYQWNDETKTLEKLIKPKFKVGDIVKTIYKPYKYEIKEITDTHYTLEEVVNKFLYTEPIIDDKNWELVPNKFDITTLKPFDSKVLVRHNKDSKWCASFFSHIDNAFHSHCYKFVTVAGKSYPYCIPYEGNEHLHNTTNPCSDYYLI